MKKALKIFKFFAFALVFSLLLNCSFSNILANALSSDETTVSDTSKQKEEATKETKLSKEEFEEMRKAFSKESLKEALKKDNNKIGTQKIKLTDNYYLEITTEITHNTDKDLNILESAKADIAGITVTKQVDGKALLGNTLWESKTSGTFMYNNTTAVYVADKSAIGNGKSIGWSCKKAVASEAQLTLNYTSVTGTYLFQCYVGIAPVGMVTDESSLEVKIYCDERGNVTTSVV